MPEEKNAVSNINTGLKWKNFLNTTGPRTSTCLIKYSSIHKINIGFNSANYMIPYDNTKIDKGKVV
jgi:hypothetical protein